MEGDLQIPTNKDSKCMPNDVNECIASEVQDEDIMAANKIKRKYEDFSKGQNDFEVHGIQSKRRCLRNDDSNKYSFIGEELKDQENQKGSNAEQTVDTCTDVEAQNPEQESEATTKSAVENTISYNVLLIKNEGEEKAMIENDSLKKNKVEKVDELGKSEESNNISSNENKGESIELESNQILSFTPAESNYLFYLNDSPNDEEAEKKTKEEVGECSTNEGQNSELDTEYLKSFLPESMKLKNSETYPYISLNEYKKMMKEKIETLTDHQVPENKLPAESEEASTSFVKDSEEREIDYNQINFYCDDIMEDSPVESDDGEDTEFHQVKHPVDLPNLKQLIINKKNKSLANENNYHDNQNLSHEGSSMQSANDTESLKSSQDSNHVQDSSINNASADNDSTSQSEEVNPHEEEIFVLSDDSNIEDESDNEDSDISESNCCITDNNSLDGSDSNLTERNNDEESNTSLYESESEQSITLRVSISENSSEDDQVDIYDQETIVFGDNYENDDKNATTSTTVENQNFGDINTCANNPEKRYFHTINNENIVPISTLPDEKKVYNDASISTSSDDNNIEVLSKNETNKSPEKSSLKIIEESENSLAKAKQTAQINDQIDIDETSKSQKPFAQINIQAVNSEQDNEVVLTILEINSSQISHQSEENVYDNIQESPIQRTCQIIKDDEIALMSVENDSRDVSTPPEMDKNYDGDCSTEEKVQNMDDGNKDETDKLDEEEIF